jgi:hypothetical protein
MNNIKYFFNLFLSLFILHILAIALLGQPLTIWSARYNSPSSLQDSAIGIAVSPNGNVLVTGWSISPSTGADIVTIRYNPITGDSMWVGKYAGPYEDKPYAIITDNNFVYITGWTFTGPASNLRDVITIKYNVVNGIPAWVKTFHGGYGGDYGLAIALDASGDVYVTGRSDVGGQQQKITTLKYDVNGNMVSGWPSIYTGTLSGIFDEGHAIQVDVSGNVYVTGRVGTQDINSFDFLTLKINSSGVVQWAKRYNGTANMEDNAIGLVLNSTGTFVYSIGYCTSTSTAKDYVTIKYNTATGDSLAAAIYDGPAHSYDIATGVVKDPSDNIYVTGYSLNNTFIYYDYATIKYDPNLNQSWVMRYSVANGSSLASAIAYDTSGFVYVTGSSFSTGTGYDYTTIRYDASNGMQKWVKTFNGVNNNDFASDIATSGPNNVYVTGSANWGSPTGLDFYTFRYAEVIGIKRISTNIPARFSLYQNYPNPFNPSTSIKFDISRSSFVNLSVYDILGREVAVLVHENLTPGTYEYKWDAAGLTSGIYFYKIYTEQFTETKKMVLTK